MELQGYYQMLKKIITTCVLASSISSIYAQDVVELNCNNAPEFGIYESLPKLNHGGKLQVDIANNEIRWAAAITIEGQDGDFFRYYYDPYEIFDSRASTGEFASFTPAWVFALNQNQLKILAINRETGELWISGLSYFTTLDSKRTEQVGADGRRLSCETRTSLF
jgi:hypothetical protein